MSSTLDQSSSSDANSSSEPLCEQCGVPRKQSTWCLSCGYYPAIGTYVDLTEMESDQAEGQTVAAPASMFGLLGMLPGWVWLLIVQLSLIVAMSVGARFWLAEQESTRMIWSLSQFGLGMASLLIAHAGACMNAIMLDSTISFVDFLMKPLMIWTATLRDLPRTARRLRMGVLGLVTTLLAVAVVGGLPYHWIWSWGPTEETRAPHLAEKITSLPREESSSDSIGSAIEEFAGNGTQAVGGGSGSTAGRPIAADAVEEEAARTKMIDCVILGYFTRGDEKEFSAAILGGSVDGRLGIVGALSDGITGKTREELLERLRQLHRDGPAHPSTMQAQWVDPVVTCRVRYEKWSETNRLVRPQLVEMLEELPER